MRRTTGEKVELIRLVEGSDLSVRRTLRELRLNRSTFYAWYQRDLDRRGRRSGRNGAGPDERAVVRRRGAGGDRGRCWPGGGGDRVARHHARRDAAPAVGTGATRR